MTDSEESSRREPWGDGPGDPWVDDSTGASGTPTPETGLPFPAIEFLKRPSPTLVLASIVDGDPLGIEARCIVHLRDRAFVLPLERLVLRTMARISISAMVYRGEPPLAQWIRGRIDDSIDDLVGEDRESEFSGIPPGQPLEHHFAIIVDLLGVEPGLSRRACLVVNDLPDDQRKVVWALVIEGLSLERYVALGHEREQAKAALRKALLAISDLGHEKFDN